MAGQAEEPLSPAPSSAAPPDWEFLADVHSADPPPSKAAVAADVPTVAADVAADVPPVAADVVASSVSKPSEYFAGLVAKSEELRRRVERAAAPGDIRVGQPGITHVRYTQETQTE